MERAVHFKNAEGERLAGTLHLPESKIGRGIVLAHCFTCSRHTRILSQVGRDLAGAGLMALRFDFSGNGQSEGDFVRSTYTKQISEMELACDFLSSQGVSRIGMAGHSMGAVSTLLTVGKRTSLEAVCTIAGRLSGTSAMRFLNQRQKDELHRAGRVVFTSRGRQLTVTRDFVADAARFDLSALIPELKVPLLIVHGDKDEIIPVDEAHNAHALNPEKSDIAIISGADHMFSQKDHRETASRKIVAWFDDQFNLS